MRHPGSQVPFPAGTGKNMLSAGISIESRRRGSSSMCQNDLICSQSLIDVVAVAAVQNEAGTCASAGRVKLRFVTNGLYDPLSRSAQSAAAIAWLLRRHTAFAAVMRFCDGR